MIEYTNDNLEQKVLDNPIFNDTKEKDENFKKYWNLFLRYEDERNKPVRFLNKEGVDRNILEYIEESVDRMNERHLKAAHKEDWQNNVFDPITRGKLITVLSQLASARLKPNVSIVGKSLFKLKSLKVKASIFSDLLEVANIHNEDDYQLIWEMYTCLSEGTVFGFESWSKDTRTVEYVKEYDPDTGEKKVETIEYDAWDDVFGEIIPTEEFYPETTWVNAKDFKQKVLRAFRVREMTQEAFYDKFKNFKNADKVKPVGQLVVDKQRPDWGVSSNVHQDNIQIIEFWDASQDKMGIWANGTEIYYGCLPWNHKSLPVWVAIGEPIHQQYLYGKSLPDKLLSMQDVTNATLNAMLDQLFMALNSPIFIDGVTDLDQGYLEPGAIHEIESGAKIQKASLGQIDQTAFQMLNLIKRSMEETSVSAQAQGVPTGGRKTKYEVQALQEGSMNIASLTLQMMEYATKHKYWLRMYNILQYYSMPSRDKSGKKKFKFLTAKDRKLTNGNKGTRLIQIVGTDQDRPPREELKRIASQEDNKEFSILEMKTEPIVITRDFLMNREFDMFIDIVPNSSVKESPTSKANKDIAFYQATQQNPLIDQVENTKDFAKAFGKDDSIVKEPEPQPEIPGLPRGLPGLPGMKGQPAPQAPAPNLTEDIL